MLCRRPCWTVLRVWRARSQALRGCDRAIALTGRGGANFRVPNAALHDGFGAAAAGGGAASRADGDTRGGRGGAIALVFGNEAVGLSTNDTLQVCVIMAYLLMTLVTTRPSACRRTSRSRRVGDVEMWRSSKRADGTLRRRSASGWAERRRRLPLAE